jgi:bifunctional enzyme CysN/CysC|tara:strand:+ start:7383 stop:7988 length:606 start_codon:yes stop_codon:yes gene_type:complete
LDGDAGGTSPDVVWQPGLIERDERWESTGQQGATIWFTGLSGSGKSTIASACEGLLVASGRAAYMLDGDNIRHGLSGDLGFSDEDRGENMRRVAEVARLFADSGTIALVALISPYLAGRRNARAIHEGAGLKFLEVFVDTPLEVCEERDVKGFYALARTGQMPGFTGVDGPFERPEAPDLVLTPDDGPAVAAATRVLDLLA